MSQTPPLLSSGSKIDLSRSRALLVDDNPVHLDLLSGILSSFELRKQTRCESVTHARDAVLGAEFDLILVEAALTDGAGFDFIRWLRREAPEVNRSAAILVVTSGTRLDEVSMARDCGASFVVAKPVTPQVLLQRIVWLGRDRRQFVDAENYAGPDRRFKAFGPPVGMRGRRHDDLGTELGAASEPNMSQNEIDMLMKPTRVSL